MARFNILTLVNPGNEDFVDKHDGEEYVVPAHGELPVPDFIAYHFVGDPKVANDQTRAKERRGLGGKQAIGIPVQIKSEDTHKDEQFLVVDNKPVATVKVSAKEKEEKKA